MGHRVISAFILVAALFGSSYRAESTPTMVHVSAGTFIMGDGVAECGEDEHEVTLAQDFYLGQHEVTNGEYLEALQWAYDQGHVTVDLPLVKDNLDGSTQTLLWLFDSYSEIQFDGAGTFYLRESPSWEAQSAYPGGYDPESHPVIMVSWYGAARFCDWLSLQSGLPRAYQHRGDWACNGGDPYSAEGFRLPTDAEWEYAAQFDDERIYPWGNGGPSCGVANSYISGACVGWTSSVGSYPDAPAGLGLSDLAGNVWEWCNDNHVCDLGSAPATNPTGPAGGSERVSHGGSWFSGLLRCSFRADFAPYITDTALGFRIAITTSPLSGVDENPDLESSGGVLRQNCPNPFNPRTTIAFLLPQRAAVDLRVFDVTGRLITVLIDGTVYDRGCHEAIWQGGDSSGRRVAAGTYFYRLQAGDHVETKRMTLLK